MRTVYLTRRKDDNGHIKTLVFKKGHNGRMQHEAFATFPASQAQPHGNLKTITINCWNYKVVWFGRK